MLMTKNYSLDKMVVLDTETGEMSLYAMLNNKAAAEATIAIGEPTETTIVPADKIAALAAQMTPRTTIRAAEPGREQYA